jgi:hypothetical protein
MLSWAIYRPRARSNFLDDLRVMGCLRRIVDYDSARLVDLICYCSATMALRDAILCSLKVYCNTAEHSEYVEVDNQVLQYYESII